MNAKKIVIEYLKEHGLDGLCNPDAECGCGLDDLAPCGEGFDLCVSAKRRTATASEKEYGGFDYFFEAVEATWPTALESALAQAQADLATEREKRMVAEEEAVRLTHLKIAIKDAVFFLRRGGEPGSVADYLDDVLRVVVGTSEPETAPTPKEADHE